MTTASKLTMVRIAMIPVFMALFLTGHTILALVVFIVASLTDFIDGYVARHYNQVSNFGKFLDPLADKLLVLSCMCILTQWGRFPAWALMAVLVREFAVTGLRLVAVEGGRVIAAGWSGKVKTASTMIGLCIMIVFSIGWLDWVITVLIVATTVYSGCEYFIRNFDVLGLGGKTR